jgi:hypothetical protein
MDITIELLLPERGETDLSKDAHPRYKTFSVVEVYDHLKQTDVIGMARTGYIHVTGVPIERFVQLQRLLTKVWEIEHPDRGSAYVAHRRWFLQWQRMSLALRRDLRDDRQATVTWQQFRALLRDLKEDRDLRDADLD